MKKPENDYDGDEDENKKIGRHYFPYQKEGINYQAFVNTGAMCDTVFLDPGMTQGYFRVWGVLWKHMAITVNRVDLRQQRIAELAGVSRGVVHRALQYFEKKNFIIREQEIKNRLVWRVNPELTWKWSISKIPGAKKRYNDLSRKERWKNRGVNKVADSDHLDLTTGEAKEKDIKNNNQSTDCDTIPIETTYEPGDASCASKLKAA